MEEKGDVKKTDVDLEINLYFSTVNNQGSPAWNHNFSTPHTGRPKGKKTKENKLHITQKKKKKEPANFNLQYKNMGIQQRFNTHEHEAEPILIMNTHKDKTKL